MLKSSNEPATTNAPKTLQSSTSSSNSVGIGVGVSVGFVALLLLVAIAVVIGIILIKKKVRNVLKKNCQSLKIQILANRVSCNSQVSGDESSCLICFLNCHSSMFILSNMSIWCMCLCFVMHLHILAHVNAWGSIVRIC